jgi:hypothetical protein
MFLLGLLDLWGFGGLGGGGCTGVSGGRTQSLLAAVFTPSWAPPKHCGSPPLWRCTTVCLCCVASISSRDWWLVCVPALPRYWCATALHDSQPMKYRSKQLLQHPVSVAFVRPAGVSLYSLPGRFSREVYWCMLHVGTASCALLLYCTFQHPISDGTATCWWACLLLSDPCWVLWGAVCCLCVYEWSWGVVSSVPPRALTGASALAAAAASCLQ